MSPLELFAAVAREPNVGLAEAARNQMPVVRTVGVDAPVELILASGALPVRMVAPPVSETPDADRLMGKIAMGDRGKRLLQALLGEPRHPVLITHTDALQPQLYAALRELDRLGERVPDRVHFLDLLHFDRASSAAYNEKRFAALRSWLADLTGRRPTDGDIEVTLARLRRQQELIGEVSKLRWQEGPKLRGSDVLNIIAATSIVSPETHIENLEALIASADSLPARDGAWVFISGSPHEDARIYEAIESLGAQIVGESHEWGDLYRSETPADATGLYDPALRVVARIASPSERAKVVASEATRRGAQHILHFSIDGDEAAPWDLAALRLATDLPVLNVRCSSTPDDRTRATIADFLAGAAPAERAKPSVAPAKQGERGPRGERSRKSLQSLASFGAYQREWFAQVRADVAQGAPFAVVNANAPQEILRTLGIPFVVNQWWASIVAAKQQSPRYQQLLRERGYPTNVEAYSAQGLAAAFDDDPAQAPWGGLPNPDFLFAVASSDPTVKIFSEWAEATSAESFVYERTVDPRWSISQTWWEDLPDRWDETLEAERIDLMVAELRTVIARLEERTGRSFDPQRFEEVMQLVNEQEHYYRLTRDLIARSTPAPISIADSMPATMVPQWHRGTEWGRDAARAFYEEVRDRVDRGLSVASDERIRLMWVGRGLWSDMGFYQSWEESHGAVFVWSMYLGLAADGYIREYDRGRDPMRALAARFITMGDELRMPTWAGPWHAHEAKTHDIDAAVALQDADPFVVRALREAGVPVLELPVDNFAREGEQADAVKRAVTDFIEGPALQRSEARRVTA